jgi:hypothetical protein
MLMASKANLQLNVKSKPIILFFCAEQEICTGFMQTKPKDFETIRFKIPTKEYKLFCKTAMLAGYKPVTSYCNNTKQLLNTVMLVSVLLQFY